MRDRCLRADLRANDREGATRACEELRHDEACEVATAGLVDEEALEGQNFGDVSMSAPHSTDDGNARNR